MSEPVYPTPTEVTLGAAPPTEPEATIATGAYSLRWAIALTVACMALVLGFAVASAFAMALIGDVTARAFIGGGLLVAAYASAIALVVAVTRVRGMSLAGALSLRAPASWRAVARDVALAAVAGRLAAAGWAGALELVGVRLPGGDLDPTKLLPGGLIGTTLVVLVTVIFAPVAEELIFRGVLFGAIGAKWGASAAIVVTAVAFAAMHVLPYALPPVFVFALVLGLVLRRHGSLWAPILAHAAFNGIGIAGLYGLRMAGWS